MLSRRVITAMTKSISTYKSYVQKYVSKSKEKRRKGEWDEIAKKKKTKNIYGENPIKIVSDATCEKSRAHGREKANI